MIEAGGVEVCESLVLQGVGVFVGCVLGGFGWGGRMGARR